MASLQHELTIDPRHASFHRASPAAATVRIIEPEDAQSLIPSIYDRLRLQRPGFIQRSQPWWETRFFSDHSSHRGGATALRFAVADDESGYLIYRQKSGWEDGHGTGEVRVIDLLASTPGAWAGLWRLALRHDLVTRVTASLRPPDDPLIDLLAAPRRALGRLSDGVWVRLLDLPVALSARSYQGEGRVVLAVSDPFLERSDVVELVAEDGVGHARTSAAQPDIHLDIEDLSAAYLGLSRFQSLAALGRLRGAEAAVRLADHLFTWSPQPWCPEIF
jgi:predicted acetyltransferase